MQYRGVGIAGHRAIHRCRAEPGGESRLSRGAVHLHHMFRVGGRGTQRADRVVECRSNGPHERVDGAVRVRAETLRGGERVVAERFSGLAVTAVRGGPCGLDKGAGVKGVVGRADEIDRVDGQAQFVAKLFRARLVAEEPESEVDVSVSIA